MPLLGATLKQLNNALGGWCGWICPLEVLRQQTGRRRAAELRGAHQPVRRFRRVRGHVLAIGVLAIQRPSGLYAAGLRGLR